MIVYMAHWGTSLVPTRKRDHPRVIPESSVRLYIGRTESHVLSPGNANPERSIVILERLHFLPFEGTSFRRVINT